MRLRFWGTRGSIAKPGPSTLRYGGNTSCVEVRAADGTLIVLDCGTGAHGLGRALVDAGKDAERGHLLITHTHWDHIQGFPFFAPLRAASNEWDVYGPRGVGSSLRETLAGQMNYTYFPVELEGLDAKVHYHELVEGVFELGDVKIEARYLNHPAVTLGYRIEADGVTLVYATDHEPHSRRLGLGERDAGPSVADDAHAAFLEGADLVIHDTQYKADEYPRHVGYGHSTVEYVVDRTCDRGIGRLAIFHHDPLRDDPGVDRMVEIARQRIDASSDRMEVFGAAEGMAIELLPRPGQAGARSGAPSARRAPRLGASEQHVVLAVRERKTLAAFREAARADKLGISEAPDQAAILRLARKLSPSLILFERALFGSEIETAAEQIRNAAGADADALKVVGISEEAQIVELDSMPAGAADEWVTTPITREYARTRMRAWLLRTGCRWRRAPMPPDEAERIKVLHELDVLDTPPEERFDRFTRIAASLFKVPCVLVSLVDSHRQWFKANLGSPVDETPRDQAFCAHAILEAGVFQVSDARAHPDFADNPLVTGPPHVRFYAGVPLTVDGDCRVGTLCLVDYRPRTLDAAETALLRDLGALVERELTAKEDSDET